MMRIDRDYLQKENERLMQRYKEISDRVQKFSSKRRKFLNRLNTCLRQMKKED